MLLLLPRIGFGFLLLVVLASFGGRPRAEGPAVLPQQPPAELPKRDGPVRLELLRTFRALGGVVHAAAFSPDGTVLATADELGGLRALELATGRILWQQLASDHWAGVVAYSPDGTRIACRARHLIVHDSRSGGVVVRRDNVGPSGFAWLRDGAFAYASGGSVIVSRDGEPSQVRAKFQYPVNAIAAADDGALFVGDNVGRTWRLEPDGSAARLLRDHRDRGDSSVRSCALAWAGGVLFDLASQGRLHRGDDQYEVPGDSFAFAASTDGRAFAVGGSQRLVRWWREPGAAHQDLDVAGSVSALALHPDGKRLFYATYDGAQQIRAVDGATQEVPPHPARIADLETSPDGSMLAIRGRTWMLQPTAGGPPQPLSAERVVPGRRGSELIAVESNRLLLLEPHRRRELAAVMGDVFQFSPVAAGPGETLLIEGRYVDAATGAVVGTCDELRFANAITVARTEHRWCAGTVSGIEGDHGVLVLTDSQGKQIGCAEDPVYAVAFSPDGSKIFYGCGTGVSFGMGPPGQRLRVRDAKTFELLEERDAQVRGWWFLDDNHALVLGTSGLELWDVQRLERMQSVRFEGRKIFGFVVPGTRTLLHATAAEVEVYRLHFEPPKK